MGQVDDLITELSTINPDQEPHIVINDERFITVPKELRRIAVQHDHNVETVTFDCPRYWDGHDMSEMTVYINYARHDNTLGSYLTNSITIDDTDNTIMHFDWTISEHVSEINGNLAFLVCIKKVDVDGSLVNHWNSELNTEMYISQGLECNETLIESYPDIITQLLSRMENTENNCSNWQTESENKWNQWKDETESEIESTTSTEAIQKHIYDYIESHPEIVIDKIGEVVGKDDIENYVNTYLTNNPPIIRIGGEKPVSKCLWFDTGEDAVSVEDTSLLILDSKKQNTEIYADVDDKTYGVTNAKLDREDTKATSYNFDIL